MKPKFPPDYEVIGLRSQPPHQPLHPLDFYTLYYKVIKGIEDIEEFEMRYTYLGNNRCTYELVIEYYWEGNLDISLHKICIETPDPTLSTFTIIYHHQPKL